MAKPTSPSKIRQVLANALDLVVWLPYRGTETSDDPAKVIVPIGAVKRDPENARLHPERNIGGIRASLRRRGQATPIVVDRTGMIAKGNGTHESAELEGWQFIWIVTTHLTGMELRAYGIADNQTGLTSEWDPERLPAHLRDLRQWVPDTDDVPPFNDDDLGCFEESEPPEIDEPPPPAAKTVTPRTPKPPPPDAADRATNALAIALSPNMRITIDSALAKVRVECEDNTMTEGKCLELICADYIAGP